MLFMEKYFIPAALALGAAVFGVLSLLIARCNSGHLAQAEKFLRNKFAGAVLGAAALAWCVPQVEAVIWRSWVPWLWYIALAALVLSLLYLDNVVARAFAGLLIMGAYSFLDMSFDYKLAMYISGAIPAWVWGAVGIVIAAKPCYLRDFLRLGAEKRFWRYLASALAGVTALFLLGALVLFWNRMG